jgi:hypothetical protein
VAVDGLTSRFLYFNTKMPFGKMLFGQKALNLSENGKLNKVPHYLVKNHFSDRQFAETIFGRQT